MPTDTANVKSQGMNLRARESKSRERSSQRFSRISVASPQTIHTLATEVDRETRRGVAGIASRKAA